MKLSRLENVFAWLLLIVMAVIVVHAPLTVWLGTFLPNEHVVILKSWKELILLAAAILAVIIVTKRQLWREFWNDWLFRLIVAFAALHFLLLAVTWTGAAQSLAGLAIDLRFVLMFSLVYVLMRIRPNYRRQLLVAGLAGAFVVATFGFLQVAALPKDVLSAIGYGDQTIQPYLTVDKNDDYVRINSTLRGPNPLGAYLVIVLSLLLAFTAAASKKLSDNRRRIGLAILGVMSLVGLWASFSRSAWGAFVLSAGLIGMMVVSRRWLMRWRWALAGLAVGLLLLGVVFSQSGNFVSHVIFHTDPNEAGAINSDEAHLKSLATGSKRMLSQPLGGGVGSTGSASLYGAGEGGLIIENHYLFIAHETGWLGLGLFVAIFAMILVRLWRRKNDWLALGLFASGIGLAVIGLVLPVWADDTVAIIWWGLAAVALGGRFRVR